MNKFNYFKNALSCNPFEVFNRIMKTDSGKIAYKRTSHVLRISLSIYIPLICLSLFSIYKFNHWGLLVLLAVLLSAFPFAKYFLIPLSEKKKEEIEKSILGLSRKEQFEKYK